MTNCARQWRGKGLGTPATRAQIIENLIDRRRYIVRDGEGPAADAQGFDLMTLQRPRRAELTAPELTGEWEFKLAQMERGKLKRDLFMREIGGVTKKIVQQAKSYESDTVPIEDPAHLATRCPKCSGPVVENYRRFACTKCDFSIPKHPGSRSFEVEEVEDLLKHGTIGPMSGFISKIGIPFSAVLKLTPEHKLEFDFGQDSGDGTNDEAVDFSGQQPLGPCPKCGGSVFEQPMNYLCERATGPAKSCDFRSGKVILQQPIEREQMEKRRKDGRTDVLRGFVSNRTRRKFAAFLVRKPDGTVGFEFEPRTRSARPAGRAGAGADADAAKPAGRAAKRVASSARVPATRRWHATKSAAPARAAVAAAPQPSATRAQPGRSGARGEARNKRRG
jgi:DNA topoisomerase-3